MWEICISEFNLKHHEFLFEFSPAQIFLLTGKRADRNTKGGSTTSPRKEGSPMSMSDAHLLAAGGFDGG